jgi:hypothetical protein
MRAHEQMSIGILNSFFARNEELLGQITRFLFKIEVAVKFSTAMALPEEPI